MKKMLQEIDGGISGFAYFIGKKVLFLKSDRKIKTNGLVDDFLDAFNEVNNCLLKADEHDYAVLKSHLNPAVISVDGQTVFLAAENSYGSYLIDKEIEILN